MKNLINQIKIHAEAAKTEPDVINHLDAIIGACGMLAEALEHQPLDIKQVIREHRENNAAMAKRIDLNAIKPENLVKAYYDRECYIHAVLMLDEILKKLG